MPAKVRYTSSRLHELVWICVFGVLTNPVHYLLFANSSKICATYTNGPQCLPAQCIAMMVQLLRYDVVNTFAATRSQLSQAVKATASKLYLDGDG